MMAKRRHGVKGICSTVGTSMALAALCRRKLYDMAQVLVNAVMRNTEATALTSFA